MLLGSTHDETTKREAQWRRRYAYFPVRLLDGRLCWLQHYFVRVSTEHPKDTSRVFVQPIVQRVASK